MNGILEQADLDYLALQPCELPHCDRHPGWCWMHPDCHVTAAVILTACDDGRLCAIRCGSCMIDVGYVHAERVRLRCQLVAVLMPGDKEVAKYTKLFVAACHRNGWLVMSYAFGAGVLEVLCAVCHESLGRIGLPGH